MKEKKPDLRNKLMNDLRMLESDVYNYQHINLLGCDQISEKAALITICVSREEGIAKLWVPKSVLRLDKTANLWVENWFYEKEIYKLF